MPAKKTGIQPLADRVLVVAVGPGRMNDTGKRMPLELKKGDKVLFGKYSGTEVTFGDQEYVIMREDDILAVIG